MSIQHCPTCGSRPHTQDELHGKGKRVFNEHTTKTNHVRRCTVCGHTISVSLAPAKKAEE